MIGMRLKELREERGLTPEKLAEQLKVTKSIIWSYELEKKEPSSSHIKLFADFFNVSQDYLLKGKKKKITVNLQDSAIFSEYELLVDEQELSKDEVKEIIDYIKARRIMKNQKIDSADLH